MSEATRPITTERLAIQALAGTLGGSVQTFAVTAEVQQIAILGIAAILAGLPETAKIPRDRLSAALVMLAHGRSKEFTQRLAAFISGIVVASRQVPAFAAQIEAATARKN
jgi:hypothetical protein